MLKSFRYLLFPIALLYRWVIWLRNKLFDHNILKSASFNFPLIGVGNLAVGGTGKTPMTELIVEHLKKDYSVATLSRGYKRRTKGFAIANEHTTALDIGDEPMQFHRKFPDITVAVGEERIVAIPQILHQKPDTEVIILDDAFQHRTVRAGFNIILTDYQNLYTRDLMFPSGDLRDVKSSSKRADFIIITKCKPDLSIEEQRKLAREINPLQHQRVFFTTILYGNPYHLFNPHQWHLSNADNVLLICGIANPKPIKEFLNQHTGYFEVIQYADHHIFSTANLDEIITRFNRMTGAKKIILTTEKDAVRLEKFKSELFDYPIYVLPVKHDFLFGESVVFFKTLKTFIEGFPINSHQMATLTK